MLHDLRILFQGPHVHGYQESEVVVKTLFDKLFCFHYHFVMNRDRKMRFSSLQSKLKIDVVSSKFERNRCRGSRDVAKNVRALKKKIWVMFLHLGNLG